MERTASTAMSSNPAKIAEVARRLDTDYGPRQWRRDHEPVDELVMTILSQHTSDSNTERAYRSLRARFPTWDDVRSAATSDVADAIRSGGLANLKAPRIQAVLDSLFDQRGSLDLTDLAHLSVSAARSTLTKLNGVGPKTASCVLLFSLGMPALPVDTHVHRVARRIGLIGSTVTAEAAHGLLEADLGGDREHVYAFHVNMIAHGRAVCAARRPFCERCPLTDCCDYFISNTSNIAISARTRPTAAPG